MTSRKALTAFLGIFLGFGIQGGSVPAHAGKKNLNEGGVFDYKPYTQAEIQAALARPLVLEDCIRIALSKSLDLLVEKGNYDIADASVSGSFGEFFPVFSLGGSMEREDENRPFDPTSPEDPTDLSFDKNAIVAQVTQRLITGASLSFSGDLRRDINSPDKFGAPPRRTENRGYSVAFRQPLLRDAWFTMAKSPITLAKQERDMAAKAFMDRQLKTIFNVKRAFYAVLLQKELIKVNEAALVRDSALVRLSNSKLRANLATRRDVLSAEIRFADDRAALIAAQTDYERAMDELKDVMGIPIQLPIKLQEVELSYSGEPLDEKFLIRVALENNPLLQAADTQIRNRKLKRRVAKNKLLPQLDLTVGYSGQFDSDTDNDLSINTRGFQVMLSLDYPFLNRSAAAEAEAAEIALTQDELERERLRRELVIGVRDVVRSTYSSIEEIDALQKTIAAAKEKVKFATMMFNLGRASNLDVTDAQEALLKAQTQYAKKLIDYHMDLALLETLIGQPIVY